MNFDDQDEMVALIEGSELVGVDLRADLGPQSHYCRLRDLRAETRADERASDNDAVSKARAPAPWVGVESLAKDALSTRGKDLEIAAWLAEALYVVVVVVFWSRVPALKALLETRNRLGDMMTEADRSEDLELHQLARRSAGGRAPVDDAAPRTTSRSSAET